MTAGAAIVFGCGRGGSGLANVGCGGGLQDAGWFADDADICGRVSALLKGANIIASKSGLCAVAGVTTADDAHEERTRLGLCCA